MVAHRGEHGPAAVPVKRGCVRDSRNLGSNFTIKGPLPSSAEARGAVGGAIAPQVLGNGAGALEDADEVRPAVVRVLEGEPGKLGMSINSGLQAGENRIEEEGGNIHLLAT